MSAPGKGGRWEPSVDQRKDWPESPGWGFVDGALRALDQQFSSGILLGEHLDSMSQSEAGSVLLDDLLGRPQVSVCSWIPSACHCFRVHRVPLLLLVL